MPKTKKPTNEETTNENLITDYLNHYKHSKQSLKMRESSLNYFFCEKYFNYSGHIFDITTKKLGDYFIWLKNLDTVNITTRRNKWHILISFIQFTMENYKGFSITIPQRSISWDGAVLKNGIVKTNKEIYATKEEIQKILTFLKNINYKHYLIFRTIIETGARKGEAINLEFSGINFNERYIKTYGKTGLKYYFFSESLGKLLELYVSERKKLNVDNPRLFLTQTNKTYSNRTFNLILKNIREKLKIKDEITCHTFRRSINDFRNDEMKCSDRDCSILLGHKILGVNFNNYTKFDLKRHKELAEKYNPYLNIEF